MSKGPGRLMRRIVEEVEKSSANARGERRLDRRTLEEVLADGEGFDRSHILRAIRSLVRLGYVTYRDARHVRDSVVSLQPPTKPLPESEMYCIIREIHEKEADS